jgi:phosphocarrier protein FPr
VSTLGIRGGDHIEITARGPDAGQALQTLAALVEKGFGELETEEAVQSGRNRVEDRGDAQTPDLENGTGSGPSGQLRGIPASPGIAAGPVRFYRPAVDPATGSSEGSRRKAGKPKTETPVPVKAPPQEELRRLQAAVEKTARRLSSVRRSSVSAAGTTAAGLIETQLLSLRDPALLERAEQAVLNGSKRAPEAWADAVDRMAASYRELDTPYLAARAGDLESLKNQVLFHLAGREQVRFELNEPSILVADDLGPADLALVDLDKVSGICTVFGGPTSHGAILARSAGIPAVVGLGPGILRIPEKTILAVDGAEGTVLADPSDLQRIQEQCGTWKNARKRALEETREPAVTRDGTRITIEANLGGVQEARYTAQAGADGVGVLRTEFLFLDRSQPPPEEELVETYLAIARVLEGRPMTVRLLDAGGDKPVPYLDMEPEANPFLGVRGVRLLPANRGLFETQIRAVLRAGYEHRVRLLVPMVSSVAEIRAVKEMISAQRWHLRAQGAGCAEYIDVGAMIEVPSAALDAERLSSEADFLSIGTNDLAQYVMAAERGNAHVSVLCDALHPPLLRLVRETAAAGFRAGVPVAVCGEIAGDPGAAVLLLGLGIRELSMNPASIPEVKRTLSRVDVKDAERFAALVVEMDSADQVRSAAGEMLSTM